MIYFKNGHEIRTWVSPDGKSMHASISTKPGPHGSMRNFNTADGQYVAGDALLTESGQIVSDAGGIFGGSEVRGPVTPPQSEKYPPVPTAPKEPHLTYSIGSHTMHDPRGDAITTKTYSGAGQHKNKVESQHLVNEGPIPEGNWKIQQVTDAKTISKYGPPVYRLVPDPATEARVGSEVTGGMGRNPHSFLIHSNNKTSTASTGCIVMERMSAKC